jgi:hypothetical protein
MQEEYDSLMTNNTWTLVPLPTNKKLVSCKWVFKIKQGANGEVERYKAKLVGRGFTQTYGVDDFILVCNDQTKLLQIKEELNQKFEMKDLGSCISFWGWRWKGIMMNESYASTKSNTSRKY